MDIQADVKRESGWDNVFMVPFTRKKKVKAFECKGGLSSSSLFWSLLLLHRLVYGVKVTEGRHQSQCPEKTGLTQQKMREKTS